MSRLPIRERVYCVYHGYPYYNGQPHFDLVNTCATLDIAENFAKDLTRSLQIPESQIITGDCYSLKENENIFVIEETVITYT